MSPPPPHPPQPTKWVRKESADKAHFYKLGQGHQNLIDNHFNYPSDTIHKVWPESIIWYMAKHLDGLNHF